MHNSILEFQQFRTKRTKFELEIVMQAKEMRIQCIRMRSVSNYYVFISVEFCFSIVANRKGTLIPLKFIFCSSSNWNQKLMLFAKHCIRPFPFNSMFNWSTGHSNEIKSIVSAFLFCCYLRHYFRRKCLQNKRFMHWFSKWTTIRTVCVCVG